MAAEMRVACVAPPGKGHIPDWLCPLFIDRLAAAGGGAFVAAAADGPADVRLVVGQAGAQGFMGHVEWTGQVPGPALGTAVKDALLSPAVLAALLDQLIERAPRP